jgi:hypothetical protein
MTEQHTPEQTKFLAYMDQRQAGNSKYINDMVRIATTFLETAEPTVIDIGKLSLNMSKRAQESDHLNYYEMCYTMISMSFRIAKLEKASE